MIDLFRLCGLARRSDPHTVQRALDDLPDDGGGLRSPVVAVLGNAWSRERYERLHLQCLAIAAASDALDRPGATDGHRWRDRLADFMGREHEHENPARIVRTGPTGDTDTSNRSARPEEEPVRPEDMSWEQYLAWLEAMRRRGHGKPDVGPSEGDCVMTSVGPFRIDDANAKDGMSVTMSDVEGRLVTMHWNNLSHPVEYEGRRYFHVVAR